MVERRVRVRALTPAADGPRRGRATRLRCGRRRCGRRRCGRRRAGRRRGRRRADAPPTAVVLGLDLGSTGSKGVLARAAVRRGAGRRLPAHRRQPGRSGQAPGGRPARGAAARHRGRGGPDRLGPRRRGDRDARRLSRPRGGLTVLNEIVAHAAAAVRSRPRRRPQPLDRRDRRPGRQVHQRARRARGRVRHEPRLQRRHGLVPRRAGPGLRARRHRRSSATWRPARARPPDLGQTCTVFVADVAAEALSDGFTRADIFAGLQYSVIKNYIGRVMGDRRFRSASSFRASRPPTPRWHARWPRSPVARSSCRPTRAPWARWASPCSPRRQAAPTGRPLRAPAATPRRSPRTQRMAATPPAWPRVDLDVFAAARVVERKSGRCGDKHCANLCRLEIGRRRGGRRAPPRGERRQLPQVRRSLRSGRQAAQGRPQPVPRARRAAGALSWPRARRRRPAAGPLARPPHSACRRRTTSSTRCRSSPAFLAALGAEVEVLRPTVETLALGDRRCAAPGACAPVKIAHGLTAAAGGARLDALFAPGVHQPAVARRGRHLHLSDRPGHAADARTRPGRRGRGAAGGAAGALRCQGARLRRRRSAAARARGGGPAARRARRRRRSGAAQARACALWDRYQRGLREIGDARARLRARRGRAGRAHRGRDARGPRPRDQLGHPRSGGRQRRRAAAARLLRRRRGSAGPALRALGRRRRDSARLSGRGRCRRRVPAAPLRLRLRAELAGRAPLRRPALRLPAHGARERRPRRQRRLCDPRTGVPARRAGLSRGAGARRRSGSRREPGRHRLGRRPGGRPGRRWGRGYLAGVAAPGAVDPRHLERCERPVALSLRNNRERTFVFGNIGGSGGRFAAAAMRGAGIDARFVGPPRPRPSTAGARAVRARNACPISSSGAPWPTTSSAPATPSARAAACS